MKKKLKPAKKSWWRSVPGVITGATAAVIAVTGLLVAVTSLGEKISQGLPTETPATLGCAEYVRDIKTGVIQTDEKDTILFEISSVQSLEDARLLRLEADSKEIGKIKFLLSAQQGEFEIVSVVDPGCRQVAQNNSPGTSIVVKNGEAVTLSFGSQDYVLRLVYKDSMILGDFN